MQLYYYNMHLNVHCKPLVRAEEEAIHKKKVTPNWREYDSNNKI